MNTANIARAAAIVATGTVGLLLLRVVGDRTVAVPFLDALRGSLALPALGTLAVLVALGLVPPGQALRILAVPASGTASMVATCAVIGAMFDVGVEMEHPADVAIGLAGAAGAAAAIWVWRIRLARGVLATSCLLLGASCMLVLRIQAGDGYDPVGAANPVLASAVGVYALFAVWAWRRGRSERPAGCGFMSNRNSP